MRKACTEKQAVAKHQVCGAFLHFLDEFSKVCPAGEFKGISKNLHTQFQSGYMDPDLAHCLETQVPPGDMSAITSFRLSDGRASLDGWTFVRSCFLKKPSFQDYKQKWYRNMFLNHSVPFLQPLWSDCFARQAVYCTDREDQTGRAWSQRIRGGSQPSQSGPPGYLCEAWQRLDHAACARGWKAVGIGETCQGPQILGKQAAATGLWYVCFQRRICVLRGLDLDVDGFDILFCFFFCS